MTSFSSAFIDPLRTFDEFVNANHFVSAPLTLIIFGVRRVGYYMFPLNRRVPQLPETCNGPGGSLPLESEWLQYEYTHQHLPRRSSGSPLDPRTRRGLRALRRSSRYEGSNVALHA